MLDSPQENALQTLALTISVGERVLVRDLSVTIPRGSLVCILGRNGVGKTLTLHALAGIGESQGGQVLIGGHDQSAMSRRELARRLGLLLQVHDDRFPLKVLEAAVMGCHPRLGFWQWESAADRAEAKKALETFDLTGMDERLITSLSGGERRRLALATLCVQRPDIWLLDEPTNHLDPHHQLQTLEYIRTLTRSGYTSIASIHDPDLAGRYADYLLYLHGDGRWEFGTRDELLTPERLEDLYGTPFAAYTSGDSVTWLPAGSELPSPTNLN